MKQFTIRLFNCLLVLLPVFAAAKDVPYSFAVAANAFRYGPDEQILSHTLSAASADTVSFIVANGVKADTEPCSDDLYLQRKAIYDKSKPGLVLSLGANDWAECMRSNGESAAIERLQRLREMFFADAPSLENGRIKVVQQSASEKFRGYSENLRWQKGPVVFATLNLPANNNHYLSAAGRNSEFEDRLVANQDWLNRLFVLAKTSKARGIVLFSEANPLARPGVENSPDAPSRDGYAEIRRQLIKLSGEFQGKVLIVHNGKPSRWASLHKLSWRGNLGELGMLTGWARISVHPGRPTLFTADLQTEEN